MITNVIVICILVYAVIFIIVIRKNDNNNETKKFDIIKALKPDDDRAEVYSFKKVDFPDVEFEKICKYILQEDPNPRKAVKFIKQCFSEREEKTLLLCLQVNNPTLYNEVVSLINYPCDNFEDYKSQEIETGLSSQSQYDLYTQNGIPAEFFTISIEGTSSSVYDVISNINYIFNNLSPEEQGEILESCSKIKNKKQSTNNSFDEFDEAIQSGNCTSAEFMVAYKKAMYESE